MTIDVAIVHLAIKALKLVQMIATIYRVQAYQVPIGNPRWPQKIQDGRHKIQTSDGGDFLRIIEIALFLILSPWILDHSQHSFEMDQ